MIILIAGCGAMARQYANVLLDLNASNPDITIHAVGRSQERCDAFQVDYPSISVFSGGIKRYVEQQPQPPTQAIVAVNTETIYVVVEELLSLGITNLLIEKPGGCSLTECLSTTHITRNITAFFAFNRRFYRSVKQLQELVNEEGGVVSFHFEFHDHYDRIKGLEPVELENIELTNFCHVIDTAFYLGGRPLSVHTSHSGQGELFWHPSWGVLSGSGKTESGSVFTYRSSLHSPGPWLIEVKTRENTYIMKPLEKLFRVASSGLEEILLDEDVGSKFKEGLYHLTHSFLFNAADSRLVSQHQYALLIETAYSQMFRSTNTCTVGIIGCGQIGARMLQSLRKSQDTMDIHIFDPSEQSRQSAERIYYEDTTYRTFTNLTVHESLDTLPSCFDIIYIATASGPRFKLAMDMLSKHCIRNLVLEKVVFLDKSHFDELKNLCDAIGVRCFCNIGWTYRLSKVFADLKSELNAIEGPLKMTVEGNDWGLACNSVHLLDLYAFLTDGFEVSLTFDIFEIIAAKRSGYYECLGSVKGHSSSLAEVNLICHSAVDGVMPFRKFTFTKGDATAVFQESANQSGTIEFTSASKGNKSWKVPMHLISSDGNLMFGGLLDGSNMSYMPSLEEAMSYHVPFIDALKAGVEGQGMKWSETKFT